MSDDVVYGMSADGHFVWGTPAAIAESIQRAAAASQQKGQEKAQRADQHAAHREAMHRVMEQTSPQISEPPHVLPEPGNEPDR